MASGCACSISAGCGIAAGKPLAPRGVMALTLALLGNTRRRPSPPNVDLSASGPRPGAMSS